MVENDRFLVTNIRQYLNSDNPKLGEDKLIQELSGFSCPPNSDISGSSADHGRYRSIISGCSG